MHVQLSQISVQIAGRFLLQGVSATFPENKITAVIGRSGSGKSSLLRVINGLLIPTEGEVSINQRPFDYRRADFERLQMGYAIQGSTLFPHLTVLQNISIAARIKKNETRNQEVRARQLLEMVGLPKAFEKKYPYQLSGGEQQRVSLCRALFLNPTLLLMDEPFGALDPLTRYDMQQLVRLLQQNEPRNIVMVTHDMREAKILADQVLVLEAGRVLQFAPTQHVLAYPVDGVVRSLIQAAFA